MLTSVYLYALNIPMLYGIEQVWYYHHFHLCIVLNQSIPESL